MIISVCRRPERKQMIKAKTSRGIPPEGEPQERMDLTEQILVNPTYPDQLVTIGGNMSEGCKNQLKALLKKSMDVFAWEPVDMTSIPSRVIEHTLNLNPSIEPAAQKRRVLTSDRIQVVIKKVEEWVKAGIVRPVKSPTWISNPDDEEKMAFYTDQGTYCYTKMPFRLKNVGATYQRLVDTAFQSQIRRNINAYVDDMVLKSNDEKVLIADIAETFDNLWRIDMKLNSKKCSSGVEEGKFLRYMVTSEGIRANPEKTMEIADMQSPRTLKEMHSLSGKLAALKRFVSRSAERSFPFFEILKDITKEKKDEYRRTKNAKKAFQEIKKVIVKLPSLATPMKEETLYLYLAAAAWAVSVVLLTEMKGKQRLRRYFEAHPIKVITDQPLKQILSKAQASRKLAKYSVELGAYNIAYEPRKAIKSQVLANFLSEALVGTSSKEFFRLSAQEQSKDDVERWTLFTDGASNSKGSSAGSVLISPSDVEFTYALRLNFMSTNHATEYEALLAGLRLAENMKVQVIDVKVDSKLVASQIKGSYVASSTSTIKYLATARECIAGFKSFAIQNIPRNLNQKAEILSKSATHAFDHLTKEVLVELLTERSTYRKEDPAECTSKRGARHGAKTPKNFDDINHGPMAILSMGNGHPWSPTPSLQNVEVRHCRHRLLHKMDRSQAFGQDYREGREEIRVGQYCANGLVERDNKSLMDGIKARLGRERVGWVDEVPNVLWAHRTTLKQSNGETPFSLTYRSEAVILMEIGMPTHRTMMMMEDENEDELRLNMDLLQERREVNTKVGRTV
ncbi:reverse transcriptase domain-containing protein [Tanacetum coccineum]